MGYAEEWWLSERSASVSRPSSTSSQHASGIHEPYYYLGYFPSEDQLSFYLDIKQEGASTLSGGGAMADHLSENLWEEAYTAANGQSDEVS